MTEFAAFISYARHDDVHSSGEISEFHRRLALETKLQFGRETRVFFDTGIEWGQQWKDAIDGSLGNTSVLIPVMSPAFFQSKHCRQEVEIFLEYEKTMEATDLVRPIYFIECQEIETPDAFTKDEIVQTLVNRQHSDWRDFRFADQTSLELKRAYTQLARRIALIAREKKGWRQTNENSSSSLEVSSVSEMLSRPINFESLVAYTLLKFPKRPISITWSNALLRELDRDRYKNIQDIETVVQIAFEEVERYSQQRPEVFQFGTDFITKSLMFVDRSFRDRHNASPDSFKAAIEANITRYQ